VIEAVGAALELGSLVAVFVADWVGASEAVALGVGSWEALGTGLSVGLGVAVVDGVLVVVGPVGALVAVLAVLALLDAVPEGSVSVPSMSLESPVSSFDAQANSNEADKVVSRSVPNRRT
jgi:hypothetical protein